MQKQASEVPSGGNPDVVLRHHLPGRSRLRLRQWPPQASLAPAIRRIEARGLRVAASSALAGSLLVEHHESLSGLAVAALVRDALALGNAADPQTAPVGPSLTRGDGDAPEASVAATADATTVLEWTASEVGGLSADAARARLATFGANLMPQPQTRSQVELLLSQFATLPVALLAGSAVLSLATGGIFDAVVTLGVVAINAGIGFSSENATERLIRRLSRPVEHRVVALRDGAPTIVAARDVVPGDVLVLAPGAFVAADARILEANDLASDESALTGESLPAEKTAAPLMSPPVAVGERGNIVHAGSVITGGDGCAVVFATGSRTEAARTRLLIGSSKPPRPGMEASLATLGSQLAMAALGVSGLVLAIGIVRGEPLLRMVRSAVALAVSAIPEGLPAVATTTFALGARAMERQGTYVRALPAVESVGRIDTICLDKTGTLTANRMAVVAAHSGGAQIDLGSSRPAAGGGADMSALAEAVVLCNEASLAERTGSGTELALLEFARDAGIDADRVRGAAPLIAIRNRNHARRWMATAHGGDRERIVVKGAPEEVLSLASEWMIDGAPRPLDDDARAAILAANAGLARRGLRILGVATGDGRLGDRPPAGLTWLGLVGLADPIRSEAREAIDIFHRAGIRTVMITGDQPATALAVANDLALSRTGVVHVADGMNLAGLDDSAIARLALGTSVFARVSPADKLRIVRALQGAGRRVAMIGDGINDGPALRAATVGVAMGRSGTDVAREVADIVIADDDLRELANAIARGRATEDNVHASVRFLVSTNLSELLVMLVESLRGAGELETPMELFWLNLVTDILPALGLALAEPRGDVMARPPRAVEAPVFSRGQLGTTLLDGAGIGAAALAAHFMRLRASGPGPHTRTVTFLTLALAQIAQAWVLRDRSPGAPATRAVSQRRLEASLFAASGLLALPLTFPALRRLLGLGGLTTSDFMLSATMAAAAFGTAELRRLFSVLRAGHASAPPRQLG